MSGQRTDGISRELLGKIVDDVFDGAIEDASVIEEIYASIKRHEGETQSSINTWITSTFGEAGSNISVAARANQEMAELIMKLAIDDNDREAIEEVADVVIVLYRLVHRFDADLAEQINRKMGINRARRWDVANGHGYHVKSPSGDTITRAILDERERCAFAVETHSGFGDPATIEACVEIIRSPTPNTTLDEQERGDAA